MNQPAGPSNFRGYRRFLMWGVLPIAILGIGSATTIFADGLPATQPGSLQQISQETQQIYQQVRVGIVRLRLPTPRWMVQLAEQQNPLRKWNDRLHPEVRRRLEEEQAHPGHGPHYSPVITPSTQPATGLQPQNRAWRVVVPGGGHVVVVETTTADGRDRLVVVSPPAAFGNISEASGDTFAANNIGLLLDSQGHVLVPLYIEKEAFSDRSAPAMLGDGTMTAAHFVSSDRPTNLTLMQLDRPAGVPVHLAGQRPQEGSLVLMLTPSVIQTRLAIWTGGLQDYGVVVGLDGLVTGFTRFGQFMDGSDCRLVVDQMIQYGRVQRAVLGVVISTVRRDDPARQQNSVLNNKPAIRIEQVTGGSTADAAGFHKGDFILSLGGRAVGDTPTFAAAIAAHRGMTEFQVLRGEELLKIAVDLQP